MTSDHPGGMFSNLLLLDRLARSHGCGGLSPALAAALTADTRSSPRASLPAQTAGAGDGQDNVLHLDDYRETRRQA